MMRLWTKAKYDNVPLEKCDFDPSRALMLDVHLCLMKAIGPGNLRLQSSLMPKRDA